MRGTTTKQIVEVLRRAGAAEVHVRISAPPIYHPCFYGIDTQIETELIASTHTEPQIREFIGADTLGYLSIRGVLAALELNGASIAAIVRSGALAVHADGRSASTDATAKSMSSSGTWPTPTRRIQIFSTGASTSRTTTIATPWQ